MADVMSLELSLDDIIMKSKKNGSFKKPFGRAPKPASTAAPRKNDLDMALDDLPTGKRKAFKSFGGGRFNTRQNFRGGRTGFRGGFRRGRGGFRRGGFQSGGRRGGFKSGGFRRNNNNFSGPGNLIKASFKTPRNIAAAIMAKGGDSKIKALDDPMASIMAMKGIVLARQQAQMLGFDFRAVVNPKSGMIHMRKTSFNPGAELKNADAVIIDVGASTSEENVARAIAQMIRDGKRITTRSSRATATQNNLFGIALARNLLSKNGLDLSMRPRFSGARDGIEIDVLAEQC